MGKMAEVQRRLLEQMMGPEALGITVQNHDWWSDKVCRNFLFGTCPHVIFGNTKMDLGPCPKIHSDRILAQFNEAAKQPHPDPRIGVYRQEHENVLYGYIEDCDRRIRMSQRKLEKTPEENRKTVDLMREIGEIELSIQGGTEEIEQLGEAGKVEESMEKLKAVEALKGLKGDKERELQNLNETAGASGHQKLRVCEICGAMLSVLDSDKRLADHFGGKLHLGYQELRKLLADIAEARMQRRNAPAGPPGPYGPPGGGGYAPNAPSNAPSGPSGPFGLAPPSGPGGPGLTPYSAPSAPSAPRTPNHGLVPPADELPVVGHGDKIKREAGELVEDVKESREREHRDRGSRDRHGSYDSGTGGGGGSGRREDRYRDRDRDEKYESRRSGGGSGRYEDESKRDRRYDERERSSRRDRSRSPSKRKLV